MAKDIPESAENQSPVIAAERVSLTLRSKAGKVDILRDVDFHAAAGESVAVVGRSGSGKSSLLSILAGLERPTSGAVTVAGKSLNRLSEDALAEFRRAHIGIVFQAFHLIPTMTAHENVALPLELAGRGDAFDAAAAELEKVGLGARRRHYPDQLSGGEQQRVALARAVIGRPQILFADEPTGNLDAGAGSMVMDLLFDLQRSAGSTLILVTHDEALAARCGRIARIDDGRIVSDAPATAAAP